MGAMPGSRPLRPLFALAFGLALVAGCRGSAGEPVDAAGVTALADGDVRWTVTYDEVARADGATDCTYTRRYAAIEDRSAPWTCPTCEAVFAASSSMSDADAACYRALTGLEPSPVERIGWSDAQFFRSIYAFGPMSPTSDLTGPAPDRSGDVYEVPFASAVDVPRAVGPGSAHIAVDGALAVAVAPGDPWSGMNPPEVYTCGWRRGDPPVYDGPWTPSVGEPVPDGWFTDACGQPVRLHDLTGSYVVVDISAADCGPCQAMAAGEDAFLAEVRALDIPIDVVTLLATGLAAPFDEGPVELLDAWRGVFGIQSPVLADRGWGGAMALSLWPDALAYPSWFVLSPDLDLIGTGQGYGSYDPIRQVIVDHADGAR